MVASYTSRNSAGRCNGFNAGKYPDFNLQNTLLKLFEHNVFAGFNQGELP